MICKNCSCSIPDGSAVCPVCDKPLYETTKKKSPVKKIIVAVSVIILIAVALFVIVPTIRKAAISAKTPEEYLEYTISENSPVNESAGNILDSAKAVLSGKSGLQISTQITVHDGFYDLQAVRSGSDAVDIKKEMSWLESFETILETASTGDSFGINHHTIINGETIVTASAASDTNGIYLFVPVLYNKGIEFSKSSGDAVTDMLIYALSNPAELASSIPDGKKLEKNLDKYTGILLDNIGEVTKEKGSITVGDISQKCTVTEAVIDDEDMYILAKAILEAVKDDKDIKNMLEPMAEYASKLLHNYIDADDSLSGTKKALAKSLTTPEMLLENIDIAATELLTEIDKEYADGHFASGSEIVIKVYTDNDHEIIGFEIYANNRILLSALSAIQGSRFADEITVGIRGIPVTIVSGSGNRSFGKKNGNYKIGLGSEYIKATVRDFETERGKLCGKIKLCIGNDFPEYLSDEYISDCELELDIKPSGTQKSETEAILRYDGKEALEITFTISAKKSDNVIIPEETIDGFGGGLYEFESNADMNALISQLEKAGVPQELYDKIF